MATVLRTGRTVLRRAPRLEEVAERVPAVVYWVLFASSCVLVGVLWDISWHQSIGRDTLFSAPHLAIYVGGIVAGLSCGWLVLRTSFMRGADRSTAVPFWRFFHAPLGAWIAIWGAIAMITSAPFDDWWHNAYGLDVKILSPPHALLAAGIGAINLGALVMVLALQNRARDAAVHRRLALLTVFAAGLLLLMVATISSEYHYRVYMHRAGFYIACAIAFPIVLAAAGRAGAVRWPATGTALVYAAATLLMMWILPLFPAEPMLAPINIAVTHMVPPSFPLLLVVPAVVIDVLLRRFGEEDPRRWALALGIGVLFVISFLVVQWPFATFLMSDWAQNPLFAGDNFPYQLDQGTYYFNRRFLPAESAGAFLWGMTVAVGAATVSARIGLAWGAWMRRVRR
jgi:hypothetical protein